MSYSDFLTKNRVPLTTVIIVLIIFSKMFFSQQKPYSVIRDHQGKIALSVVMSGVLLRSWAAGSIKKNKTLVTTGAYHLCRNPLYLGSGLIAFGFIYFLKDILLWLFLIPFICFIYIPKIKKEEANLIKHFPEKYKEYYKTTGSFFPKQISLQNFKSKWSYKLWLHNSEYNTSIAVFSVFFGLEIWNKFYY